jgi:hypothetical protein
MSEEDVKQRVERMAETLELDAEQKKKILKLELDFYNKMQTVRSNNQGDFEAMRSAMQESRKQRQEKYKEILTKPQMDKLTQLMEQRMQRMQQGGPPGERQPADSTRSRGRGRGN